MARLFCILALLTLVAAPPARAMDHSHHTGKGMLQEQVSSSDATLPVSLSCDVADTTDEPMPGHGACLGCCPGKHVQGDVAPAPRIQEILGFPLIASLGTPPAVPAPVLAGARSPGLACGDFCPVLRL